MLFMAKRKQPTVNVYMRLPKALKKAIEDLANEHRRTMTTEVVIALEEYLAKHGHWPSESRDSNGKN